MFMIYFYNLCTALHCHSDGSYHCFLSLASASLICLVFSLITFSLQNRGFGQASETVSVFVLFSEVLGGDT